MIRVTQLVKLTKTAFMPNEKCLTKIEKVYSRSLQLGSPQSKSLQIGVRLEHSSIFKKKVLCFKTVYF